jgi:hypothetical protein
MRLTDKTRAPLVLCAALALVGVVLIAFSPKGFSAEARSLTIDCKDFPFQEGGTLLTTSVNAGGSLTFTLINCNVPPPDTPFIGTYTAGIASGPAFTPISSSPQAVNGFTINAGTPPGTYPDAFRLQSSTNPSSGFWIRVTVIVPTPTPTPTPTAPTPSTPGAPQIPQPTLQRVDLDAGTGHSCNVTSLKAFRGTWVRVPAAEACKSDTDSRATLLLGWATKPTFPIEIAKRQVRNGWGAYERFDAQGRRSAVFIPAGSATLISGNNTLYAIWGN